MQKFQKNYLGTTLFIQIQGKGNYDKIFSEISDFLDFFEAKFSRFIKNNWLFDLNKNKKSNIDIHAFSMIKMIQNVARETE